MLNTKTMIIIIYEHDNQDHNDENDDIYQSDTNDDIFQDGKNKEHE